MYYVIGDIHGCYDEFQKMLKKIKFNPKFDRLFFVGDYIDRGKQSYEMLSWIENNSTYDCYKFLRGNHEQEFITCVDLLTSVDESVEIQDAYDALHSRSNYFDAYGTIGKFIKDNHDDKLIDWASMLSKFPTYYLFHYDRQDYIVVHAGFKYSSSKETKEDFNLYARDEAYTEGGRRNTIIISGHTPTLVEGETSFNNGKVFKYKNKEKDCTFYNIDCGCCFRTIDERAKLACIRLDDKKIFYI